MSRAAASAAAVPRPRPTNRLAPQRQHRNAVQLPTPHLLAQRQHIVQRLLERVLLQPLQAHHHLHAAQPASRPAR